MAIAAEQLKELETHKQISPHKKYGENAGVSVSVVADLLGVEYGDMLNAMDKSIKVFNGKGYDLSPFPKPETTEIKPKGIFNYTGWECKVQACEGDKKRADRLIRRRPNFTIILNWSNWVLHVPWLNNEYVLSYYRAENKIIAALGAAKRGDVVVCEKHCGEAQAEILLAIKRRQAGQGEFRQAMGNLHTKPSLNGHPREKPPQSDDDVQRSFRNFHNKIILALQATEFQRTDNCEKYCREALSSVSVELLSNLEKKSQYTYTPRRDGVVYG